VHDYISEICKNNEFFIYSIVIMIMELLSLTVAVLAKRNFTTCQHLTKVILSHNTSLHGA